jgi:hypothetical protein
MKWLDSAAAAGRDAASRGTPIFLVVVENDANARAITAVLEDAAVIRVLRHFSCAFLSRFRDRNMFEASYIPWIGATADTPFYAPALIFGEPGGKPRPEYRMEGKVPPASELIRHLERVLKDLAPAEAQKGRAAELGSATLQDLLARLADSCSFLADQARPDRATAFREEAAWAAQIASCLDGAGRKHKSRSVRRRAADNLGRIKRALDSLHGKSPDSCRASLDELRAALGDIEQALKEHQELEKAVQGLSVTDHLRRLDESIRNMRAASTTEQIRKELGVSLDIALLLLPRTGTPSARLKSLVKILSELETLRSGKIEAYLPKLEKAAAAIEVLLASPKP